MIDIEKFYNSQLPKWPEARSRYDALTDLQRRSIVVDGAEWHVQYNSSRTRSSAACTDYVSIAARPCFLCSDARPAEQVQIELGHYDLLINPFPIFTRHLTIASRSHRPQSIGGHVADMAEIALQLPGYAVFYNGPRCGASAPDHLHFQAVPSTELPLISKSLPAGIAHYGPVALIKVVADDTAKLTTAIADTLATLPADNQGYEPMINMLVCGSEAYIIPRRAHRPSVYGRGEDEILFSPASVDVAGVAVVVRQQDFDNLTPELLHQMLSEVCYTKDQLSLWSSQS